MLVHALSHQLKRTYNQAQSKGQHKYSKRFAKNPFQELYIVLLNFTENIHNFESEETNA
jgi:hypothetical protein